MLQNSPEIPGMLHKSQGILHDVSAWGSGARLGCSRNPRAFSMSWVLSCFSRVGGAADPDGPRETFHRGFPPPGRAGKVHGDLQGTQGEGFWDSGNVPDSSHSWEFLCLSLLQPFLQGKTGISFPVLARKWGHIWENSQRICGCSIPGSVQGVLGASWDHGKCPCPRDRMGFKVSFHSGIPQFGIFPEFQTNLPLGSSLGSVGTKQ